MMQVTATVCSRDARPCVEGCCSMKWSWRIGTIAGIGVYLHFTFLILPAWLVVDQVRRGADWQVVLHSLVFLSALFGIIVLHELGHALAARRYGIQTRDITLLPIGGVARLEKMPDDPRQELIVALAGPAVNVALAFLSFLGLIALIGVAASVGAIDSAVTGLLNPGRITGATFCVEMLLVNIVLVIFNLLPAFPMDGGRVLRAVLAMNMDYVRATKVAAVVGQGMALCFAVLGLKISNPFLVFIGIFRLDRGGQRVLDGEFAIRSGWHPGSRGDDYEVPDRTPRDFVARGRRTHSCRISAGLSRPRRGTRGRHPDEGRSAQGLGRRRNR